MGALPFFCDPTLLPTDSTCEEYFTSRTLRVVPYPANSTKGDYERSARGESRRRAEEGRRQHKEHQNHEEIGAVHINYEKRIYLILSLHHIYTTTNTICKYI